MEVYLDNSATTQPTEAVRAAVVEAMTTAWYNPSSLYKPAMDAEKKVEQVRQECLRAINAAGNNMIFTSGGTEADNIAILGHMRTVKKTQRVLMLNVEHPAVLRCTEELERLGHNVQEIPVDQNGVADLQFLENMLDENVALICVMQVNNESGAIQPIDKIAALRDAKCPAAAIHVDGVQGFLRLPMDFKKSGIQSYAFSGHKIHALKGIGGLIFAKNYKISPIVFGGGQENNYRSGTENTVGILSLGEAVRTYPKEAADTMLRLKKMLFEQIQSKIPTAVINGPDLHDPSAAPHILNVALEPVRSQTMLFALEGDGIFVNSGSACASKKQKVSSVLTNMHLSTLRADCSIRFSLNPFITEEQVCYAAERIAVHYSVLSKYVRR